MTRHLVYLSLAILLTSCRFGSPVWKVTSGGPGETYASYNNGEVVSSNVISYTVFKPGQRIKENRLKISRPTESFKYVQRKPQYPDVNVSKSFVKTNIGNLLVDIIVYAAWLPSGGQALHWAAPVLQRDFILYQSCSHGRQCTGQQHTVHKNVLLETNIVAKKADLKGNVVVLDNIPDEIRVDSYQIKKKKGRNSIESVELERITKNDNNYLQMTVVPKKGTFKRNASVWLKMRVTIVPGSTELSSL